MKNEEAILAALIAEWDRRIYEESFARIKQCVSLLSEEQLWNKPNPSSNSIANLILHLTGNISQYVNAGIGRLPDQRERDAEFETIGGLTGPELVAHLARVLEDIKPVIAKIRVNDLIASRNVQGFEETTLSILIHVIEHLSYHTGQIAFYTKLLLDVDLKFYGDLDLNAKSDT